MSARKKLDAGTMSSRLKARLKQLGLSYADLAGKVGVTKQLVGQWCNGDCAPGEEALRGVALALWVSAPWLLTGEGPKGRRRELTPADARRVELRALLRGLDAQRKAARAELKALDAEQDEADEHERSLAPKPPRAAGREVSP